MKSIIEPVTTLPASDELKFRLDTIRAMMVGKELDYISPPSIAKALRK
jgi:hypothetical protein